MLRKLSYTDLASLGQKYPLSPKTGKNLFMQNKHTKNIAMTAILSKQAKGSHQTHKPKHFPTEHHKFDE